MVDWRHRSKVISKAWVSKVPASVIPSGWRIRCPELLRLHKAETSQHCVQFYDQDSFFIESVSYLSAMTLQAGDGVVCIATQPHLSAIENRLAGFPIDLGRARATGRYLELDAAETLEKLMIGGFPDRAKFDEIVESILSGAFKNSTNHFVFAFAEMVALLCAAKRADAAVGLERLWNTVAARHHLALYCAYSLACLGTDPDLNAVSEICAEHSIVLPAETLA